MLSRIKNFFTPSQPTRDKLALGLSMTNMVLSIEEAMLMGLISSSREPEFLFPYIVGTLALATLPTFLVPTDGYQKLNRFVSGFGSTTAALLALTAFKGSKNSIYAFDSALGANAVSAIADLVMKYRSKELDHAAEIIAEGQKSLKKTEAAATVVNLLKNALLLTVINMGKRFGEVSPGEVFEALKEELSDDMHIMCMSAGVASVASAVMSLIVAAQRGVNLLDGVAATARGNLQEDAAQDNYLALPGTTINPRIDQDEDADKYMSEDSSDDEKGLHPSLSMQTVPGSR